MRELLFNTFLVKIGDCELTVSLSNKIITGAFTTHAHYHLHFELHFITAGNVHFSANGEDVIAENNETVIVPPPVVHSVKDLETSERFCMTLLIRKTNSPDPDMTYENIFSRWNSLKDLTVLQRSYEKELQKILHYTKINDTFHNASVKHLLALLFLDISNTLSCPEAQDSFQKDEMSEQFYRSIVIENCIGTHYQDADANIRLIADILHLSTKQAERTVKKLTGMSFKQLLLKQRMHLAKEMIATSNKKLYEIAQCVGYNSYEVFYKAFSNYFKMSPTEFKKGMR